MNNDVKLEFISVKNKPNIPKRGVRLTHIPTNTTVEYNISESALENYKLALVMLKESIN